MKVARHVVQSPTILSNNSQQKDQSDGESSDLDQTLTNKDVPENGEDVVKLDRISPPMKRIISKKATLGPESKSWRVLEEGEEDANDSFDDSEAEHLPASDSDHDQSDVSSSTNSQSEELSGSDNYLNGNSEDHAHNSLSIAGQGYDNKVDKSKQKVVPLATEYVDLTNKVIGFNDTSSWGEKNLHYC